MVWCCGNMILYATVPMTNLYYFRWNVEFRSNFYHFAIQNRILCNSLLSKHAQIHRMLISGANAKCSRIVKFMKLGYIYGAMEHITTSCCSSENSIKTFSQSSVFYTSDVSDICATIDFLIDFRYNINYDPWISSLCMLNALLTIIQIAKKRNRNNLFIDHIIVHK